MYLELLKGLVMEGLGRTGPYFGIYFSDILKNQFMYAHGVLRNVRSRRVAHVALSPRWSAR